jgi:hypothetical protein
MALFDRLSQVARAERMKRHDFIAAAIAISLFAAGICFVLLVKGQRVDAE